MESYEVGVIVGKIITWVILALILWGIYRIWKKIFTELFYGMWHLYGMLFPNPTKKLLQSYLFWVDFVQGVASIESFKTKLGTILHAMVYKNSYGRFFLTKEEAQAQNEEVTPITIQEVLASETLPLFLLTRLERITLYDKADLKNIPKSSQMVWTTIKDIDLHMVVDNNKLIYPKDYPINNPFRFGYQIFRDANGVFGVYDVEADHFVLPFEYTYIKAYGNILILSQDNKEYFAYDLKTYTEKLLENRLYISNDMKEKMDPSKMELSAYLELIPTLKSQSDLMHYGLWGAKVWVMDVPSGYEEILEDRNIGTIEWNGYCSADIFDMSVELPVNFKKKNGEYVSVGIKHEYLTLDAEYRKKLAPLKDNATESTTLLQRGSLPDDNREVPVWLKLKNGQIDDVDISNNTVDEIVKLSSKEFNELASQHTKDLIVYLQTVSKDELDKLYSYVDEVVEYGSEAEDDTPSPRKQIEELVEQTREKTTQDNMLFSTLALPLAIKKSKFVTKQYEEHTEFILQTMYKRSLEHEFNIYEGNLSKVLWGELKYIPDYYEQILDHFYDFYDENNSEHKEFFLHLTNRFGVLIGTINNVIVMSEDRKSSLNWFVGKILEYGYEFKTQISFSKTQALTTDKKLIDFITLMYVGICNENDDNYLQNLIEVTKTLFEWYPLYSDACEYAMVEMMKSVALKEVNTQNANSFIEFFETLPKHYEVLDIHTLLGLKEKINQTLSEYKPLENKIFEQEGVKNRLILLNYKIDMEDLYYEGLK